MSLTGVDTVPFLFRFITKNLPWILSTYLPFIALLVVFLAFLALNGSVVVGMMMHHLSAATSWSRTKRAFFLFPEGDKAHHSMVFHFAQLPYFILVCSSMLAMDFLRLGKPVCDCLPTSIPYNPPAPASQDYGRN